MTAERLRDSVKRDPFEPFTIHMTDGSRLKIAEPDSLVIPRAWIWNAMVVLPRGRFTILYTRNIAQLSSRGGWPKTRDGRRKQNGSGDQ